MANMNYAIQRMVCGVVLCGDAVLLLRKNRPEWQAGRLNFMGGKLEPGETPIQAMEREAEEELGTNCSREIREWKYMLSEDGPGYSVAFFKGYLDPAMVGVSPARNDVDETFEWHPITRLPNDVIGNCRWVLAFALDPRTDLRAEVTVAGDISNKPTWPVLGRETGRF